MTFDPESPVIAQGLPVIFRDQTKWLDPQQFDRSRMICIDFDETCFTTFISNGNGIEVHEAYERSVASVLGEDAHMDFSNYGGLSNRAPLDVIQGLLTREPRFINHALDHAKEHFSSPDDLTDIGLGMVARFADRGSVTYDELTIRAITEMLVIRKKEWLIPQIGPDWPRPVEGFLESWQTLNERRQASEAWSRVHTAIVSSGHTDFIQKTMAAAGLPHPDIYMTDDEMRRQVYPRTKPDPYALELVRNAWLNAYVVPHHSRADEAFMSAVKERQVYIGDDPDKDGKMAFNDGIPFLPYDKTEHDWEAINRQLIRFVEEGGRL